MNEKYKKIFSRLSELVRLSREKFLSNPEPYYHEMQDELYRAQECFRKLEHALSSDLIFDIAETNEIRPVDINGECMIKVVAAKKIIHNYYRRG